MIPVEEHPEGAVFRVRASAGAKRNGITGEHNGMLKVSVTEAPEKGKANKAIAAVLAKAFEVRKSQVELISGPTSSEKRFLVRGLSAAGLKQKIAAALDR